MQAPLRAANLLGGRTYSVIGDLTRDDSLRCPQLVLFCVLQLGSFWLNGVSAVISAHWWFFSQFDVFASLLKSYMVSINMYFCDIGFELMGCVKNQMQVLVNSACLGNSFIIGEYGSRGEGLVFLVFPTFLSKCMNSSPKLFSFCRLFTAHLFWSLSYTSGRCDAGWSVLYYILDLFLIFWPLSFI